MKTELTDIKREWIDGCIESMSLYMTEPFTSEDIHEIFPAPPHPNYYGCLIAQMVKRKLIEEVGFKRSTRPEANGRRIVVWRMI